MNHLGSILRRAAQNFPTETAMLDGCHRWTFAQVATATHQIEQEIRGAGVTADWKVVLLIPNCPQFSLYYFASLWCQAIVVPLNPKLTDDEIIHLLNDCQADLFVFENERKQIADKVAIALPGCRLLPVRSLDEVFASDSQQLELAPTKDPNEWEFEPESEDCESTAVILYTSGSTGTPKGVALSHRALIHNAESVSREKFSTPDQQVVMGPGEIGLAALPLSHSFGQTNVQNGMWIGGGAISYLKAYSPAELLDQIIAQRVTFLPGVPTLFFDLVQHSNPKPRSSLKYCVCGGAPIAPELKRRFQERFQVTIQESYGLTETAPMATFQRVDRAQKCGSVGRPISGVEIRIVDNQCEPVAAGQTGEILIRGKNLFSGYHNQTQETARRMADGWLRTGDLGFIDPDGDLVIRSREDDVISRGGYKIYPAEVEAVLTSHPWILEAIVVGVEDERLGQEIAAFVTLDYSAKELTGETWNSIQTTIDDWECRLVEIFKKRAGDVKRPRKVRILEGFPRISTGKIDRRKLRTLGNNCESSH